MGKNGQKTSANLWVGNLMMRSYGPGLWIIGDGLPMPVGGWVTKKLKGTLCEWNVLIDDTALRVGYMT